MESNKRLGDYVKQFESGSKGPLSFSQCGNDWGISCGTYQLTLRWGNCISFLKKYFPSESSALYFKASKDFASKTYPGSKYCSSPEAVKSAWYNAYNKVGSEKFAEYEHKYIETTMYNVFKKRVKSYIDLDNIDRAFQECCWSWAIHKGIYGAEKGLKEVFESNHITSLNYIYKDEFLDMIYDYRYQIDKFNRYKKGLKPSISERETLRKLVTHETFSGITTEDAKKEEERQKQELIDEIVKGLTPVSGSIKVIYKGKDGLNIRDYPSVNSNILGIYKYGDILEVKAITKHKDFYQLTDGTFVTAVDKYVMFIPKDNALYTIRILSDKVNILQKPTAIGKVVGSVKKNQVFTIIQENNGYGLLKSKVGWIKLDKNVKKSK